MAGIEHTQCGICQKWCTVSWNKNWSFQLFAILGSSRQSIILLSSSTCKSHNGNVYWFTDQSLILCWWVDMWALYQIFQIWSDLSTLPSVLWHCWLGVRKSIWPVKIQWRMLVFCGYMLSGYHFHLRAGARCRLFAFCPADDTHTHLTALFPGLPRWAGTRKVKPIWILLKQETVSGSGISWTICKSATRSRQITTPAPHHSVFYRPDALPATQPTASKHWRQQLMTLHPKTP